MESENPLDTESMGHAAIAITFSDSIIHFRIQIVKHKLSNFA